MRRFNIVLKDNENFVLMSCTTLEIAEKNLKEMAKIDKYLADYYNWNKLPEYKIIEEVRE